MTIKAAARMAAVAGTVAVLGICIFVVAGSGPTHASLGAGNLPGKDPPAGPDVAAVPAPAVPASCGLSGLTSSVLSDGPARTIVNETTAATAVVIGTVTAIEASTWNTKDGTHGALGLAWPR